MVKNYSTYKYIYPPRPETKTPPESIKIYEERGFIGQPKLDGSCGVLFTAAHFAKLMTRHKKPFTREVISATEIGGERTDKFTVYAGEYMNKSKKGVDKKPLIGFVIFDILVYDGVHLIGKTFVERQEILDRILLTEEYDGFINKVKGGEYLYRVKNFTNLEETYKKIISINMYEGLVMKRPDAKLKPGLRPFNNTGWQVKVRKPTKNYTF